MWQWNVRKKILSGFLMVLVFFGGSLFYSIHSGRQIRQYSTRLKEKTYPAMEKTGHLIDLLRQTQEAFMAAVTESERERLGRAEKASGSFISEIGSLENLLGEEESDLAEIQRLYRNYFTRGKKVIEQILSGEDLSSLAGELNQVNATAGALNQKLKQYYDKKHGEFVGNVVGIQDFSRRSQFFTLLIAMASFLLSILISVFIAGRIVNPLNEAKDFLQEVAQRDFSRQLEVHCGGELRELAEAVNGMTADINRALSQVAETSQRVTTSAEMLSSIAQKMAAGVEEQSRQTEQIAASIEEMSASISEVADNSNQVKESARGSVEKAVQGVDSVKRTIEGMDRIAQSVKRSAGTITTLGQSSGQIGEIIEVIDDIAEQTNLLALNAAIEAARAGEHGRGFAVVADEVRRLSERTSKATKEIADMVKGIQADTGEVVASMKVETEEVEKGVKLCRHQT